MSSFGAWQQREHDAAAALRRHVAEFAASGGNPVRAATGGADTIEWRHYPEGDFYDPVSHAQFFYHRHPQAASSRGGPAEHGHFHLFLRAAGMPRGISPLVLPELAVAASQPAAPSAPAKRGARDEVCHLIAVALDPQGEPVRLFTTNRWVTGETWFVAEDVIRMLDCFQPREREAPLLYRWLAALVRLFRPEIEALLRRRDNSITEWRWRRRGNVFEDMRLETTSSLDIDVAARLAAVETIVKPRRPVRLPGMAEGWGA